MVERAVDCLRFVLIKFGLIEELCYWFSSDTPAGKFFECEKHDGEYFVWIGRHNLIIAPKGWSACRSAKQQ